MARVDLATQAEVIASNILTMTFTVSASEIADLHDNPIEIVPALGVGKGYQVVGWTFSFFWGTTGYTSSNGRLMVGPQAQVVQDYSPWETEPLGALPFMVNGPSEESPSGDWFVEIRQTSQNNTTPPELLDNQPLVLGNPNDNFVGGDGTLKMTVRYVQVDLI